LATIPLKIFLLLHTCYNCRADAVLRAWAKSTILLMPKLRSSGNYLKTGGIMFTRQIQSGSVPDPKVRQLFVFAISVAFSIAAASAQTDPGVRGGPADAGGSLAGLTAGQKGF